MIQQSEDDIEYISFKKIKSWDKYCGFVYDYITDEQIDIAMEFLTDYPDIKNDIDISVNFLDDTFINKIKDTQSLIFAHSCRISMLVEIAKHQQLDPVLFDTECSVTDVYSGVTDGHHRIRALQYLKREVFPASCAGYVNTIDSLTV